MSLLSGMRAKVAVQAFVRIWGQCGEARRVSPWWTGLLLRVSAAMADSALLVKTVCGTCMSDGA